jgi:hypothetical protein
LARDAIRLFQFAEAQRVLDIKIVALICVVAMTCAVAADEYVLEVALGSMAAMAFAAFANVTSYSRRKAPPPGEPWYMK